MEPRKKITNMSMEAIMTSVAIFLWIKNEETTPAHNVLLKMLREEKFQLLRIPNC
jgi:hypothetical protein